MKLPIDDMTINRWIRRGILDLPLSGTGHRRDYPAGERRAMVAVDSFRRLAGVPAHVGPWPPATTAMVRAVAQAARSNPPGAVVVIPSASPYVRHILIVPDA